MAAKTILSSSSVNFNPLPPPPPELFAGDACAAVAGFGVEAGMETVCSGGAEPGRSSSGDSKCCGRSITDSFFIHRSLQDCQVWCGYFSMLVGSLCKEELEFQYHSCQVRPDSVAFQGVPLPLMLRSPPPQDFIIGCSKRSTRCFPWFRRACRSRRNYDPVDEIVLLISHVAVLNGIIDQFPRVRPRWSILPCVIRDEDVGSLFEGNYLASVCLVIFSIQESPIFGRELTSIFRTTAFRIGTRKATQNLRPWNNEPLLPP